MLHIRDFPKSWLHLADCSRVIGARRRHIAIKRHTRGRDRSLATWKGIFTMLRRLAIAAVLTAFTAPLLGGCIIIATDKPTTRVVHQSSDAAQ